MTQTAMLLKTHPGVSDIMKTTSLKLCTTRRRFHECLLSLVTVTAYATSGMGFMGAGPHASCNVLKNSYDFVVSLASLKSVATRRK